MKDCTCFAVCTDPERQEMWKQIFPPWGQVPLSSPKLEGWAELGQPPDNQLVPYYLVDLARVSQDEKARLIKEVAARFESPEEEVISDIEHRGIPIKGLNLIITLCPQHERLASLAKSRHGLGSFKRKRRYDEDHRF